MNSTDRAGYGEESSQDTQNRHIHPLDSASFTQQTAGQLTSHGHFVYG
jgi:hypothetical protein